MVRSYTLECQSENYAWGWVGGGGGGTIYMMLWQFIFYGQHNFILVLLAGGTNFGFMNGGNRHEKTRQYRPTVTSYGR